MLVLAKDNKPDNKNLEKTKDENILLSDKNIIRKNRNISNLIKQANLRLYGTDRTSDIDSLNKKFQTIMHDNINELSSNREGDITSFLSQIVSSDQKTTAMEEMLNAQVSALTGDDGGSLTSFIYDAYRNKLLEQSDIHEISSQLIELSEAILIARDGIVSADVVEGRMSRNLKFNDLDEDSIDEARPIVEKMEETYKLQSKIKNFIVPKTLEYGEFYAYVIPYSVLFNNYEKDKNTDLYGRKIYRESTVFESFSDIKDHKVIKNNKDDENSFKYFVESTYKEYTKNDDNDKKIKKDVFEKDLTNILDNIVVSNDDTPLPFLFESEESIAYLKEQYEKQRQENTKHHDFFTEANAAKPENVFTTLHNSEIKNPSGDTSKQNKENEKSNKYDDLTGCYLKMIEPTRVLPVKIINTIIGYFYVQDEDITPLSGAISDTLYYSKFDEHSRQRTVIDAIASRVAKSFDKPFLEKNIKFKEAIIDCLNYYNLNEKRLKFQFIPTDYIVEFKIDEDMEGNGQSMLKKSLFYAKLYLMLLLFKIMSIILNSNDVKVNYVKQSGIDKNLANQVQEIARIRQSRQINITDLFSYTTLINKVGNGSEMYIPTGRSGERPIETEILSGQEIQLNSDLLEMLRNNYILATGCPVAIMNFLQESDFAKSIELGNTKWLGRVINYQLDFNPSITTLYQKLMKWSTNIPENVIDNFEFVLQAPKTTALTTKSEMISQFITLRDFLAQMYFGDPTQEIDPQKTNKMINIFSKKLMAEQLPMIDQDMIQRIVDETMVEYTETKLKPDPDNGDNGDDLGLDEDLEDMET